VGWLACLDAISFLAGCCSLLLVAPCYAVTRCGSNKKAELSIVNDSVKSGHASTVRDSDHQECPSNDTDVTFCCAPLQARRAERQQRFAADLASIKAATSSNGTAGSGKRGGGAQGHGKSSAAAQSEQAIGSGWLALHGGFGTNQALEKEYLRLTSVPKAEDVRPPEVR